MAKGGHGVAYNLWREVESARVAAGLTKVELAERSKVARSTIDGLRNGLRAPTVTTVHKLADVLHIDRRRAEILAGLRIEEPQIDDQVDVRAAILASPHYTEEQRSMLLAMVETIEQANGLTGESDSSPQTRAN